MAKSFMELVVGDLEEKRNYRRFMKRVDALPKEYQFAFKRMRGYMYNVDLTGCDTLFTDLLELLETSAAEGKDVLAVTGTDVAAFCDGLVEVSAPHSPTSGKKLNEEIQEYFHKGGK